MNQGKVGGDILACVVLGEVDNLSLEGLHEALGLRAVVWAVAAAHSGSPGGDPVLAGSAGLATARFFVANGASALIWARTRAASVPPTQGTPLPPGMVARGTISHPLPFPMLSDVADDAQAPAEPIRLQSARGRRRKRRPRAAPAARQPRPGARAAKLRPIPPHDGFIGHGRALGVAAKRITRSRPPHLLPPDQPARFSPAPRPVAPDGGSRARPCRRSAPGWRARRSECQDRAHPWPEVSSGDRRNWRQRGA